MEFYSLEDICQSKILKRLPLLLNCFMQQQSTRLSLQLQPKCLSWLFAKASNWFRWLWLTCRMKSMFLLVLQAARVRIQKQKVQMKMERKKFRNYFGIFCFQISRCSTNAAQLYGKLIIPRTQKCSLKWRNQLLIKWGPINLLSTSTTGQSPRKHFTPQSPWQVSSKSLQLMTVITKVMHRTRAKLLANSLQLSKLKTTPSSEPYSTRSTNSYRAKTHPYPNILQP